MLGSAITVLHRSVLPSIHPILGTVRTRRTRGEHVTSSEQISIRLCNGRMAPLRGAAVGHHHHHHHHQHLWCWWLTVESHSRRVQAWCTLHVLFVGLLGSSSLLPRSRTCRRRRRRRYWRASLGVCDVTQRVALFPLIANAMSFI